jgi:hypothetical protein
MLTYSDVIDHLVEFAAGQQFAVSQDAIRQAIAEAYEEIAHAHCWRFLQRTGRIHLHKIQSTGTAVYTHSTRQLVLSGATWPAWAEDASVRIGGVVCDIDAVTSTTAATLHESLNPGQDVASTTYVLFPRWYHLPADFLRFTGPWAQDSWRFGREVSLTEMLKLYRFDANTGDILYHAIGEVPDVYDRLALYTWPPSADDKTLDFLYTRRPRELRYSGHEDNDWAGTVSTSYGSEDLVGSGSAFESDMAGAILRTSRDANRPTGRSGAYPWTEERSIKTVTDTTHLTLDGASGKSLSTVGYMVTDPIDLGRVAHNAFRRLCELNLAIKRNTKIVDKCRELYERALLDAMGADNPLASDPATDGTAYPRAYERVDFGVNG